MTPIIADLESNNKFVKVLETFERFAGLKKDARWSCLVWSGSLLGFNTARYGDFDFN